MDWKVIILERLRVRNSKESGGFTELVASHGKLQDQAESLKKEITRLEYQKNELERERDEDSGAGTTNISGDASKEIARYRKKVEDLQTKLTSKIEEMMEKQTQWVESMSTVRKKDDDLRSKDNAIKQLENKKKSLEKEVESLKTKLQEQESANVTLKDEILLHQMASNSHEEKIKTLTKDYDLLRNQLILIRSKQADELNEANEIVRKERDKRLEDDIKRASEEKDPFLDSRSVGGLGDGVTASMRKRSSESGGRRPSARTRDGGDRKASRSNSGTESAGVDVVGPSICPATTFYTFDAHDNEVSALGFSGDGNYLATGGGDKLVKVWSWRPSQSKMELKYTLRGCTQSIMSVQFDQNCRQVLAGSNDGSARIWTLHDERSKHALTGHANRVMAAKFLEDNNKVVTGSHDRTLKIWDLQHKACTKTLFAGSSCNDVVAGRGMGTTVISGHFDRRIRFWDTRTATANEIALQGKVTSLDHYPEKHWLLCCSRDDALRLIDLRQNSIMTTFNAAGFRVGVDWTRACFSPDGQYVAAGSSDGSLFIWDTYNSSKPKREKCKEHNKDVVVCGWDPTGQLFITGDRNKKAILWKR